MEENNYTEENQQDNSLSSETSTTTLIISDDIKSFLTETVKWGKFLAIVGFVFTGLIVLIGIGMMSLGSKILSELPMENNPFGGSIGIFYALLGLIYYFPSKYLYDFSVYIKQALEINDQESLAYGFSRLKSLYKFFGILMVICIIFYVIIIVFAVSMILIAGSLNAG